MEIHRYKFQNKQEYDSLMSQIWDGTQNTAKPYRDENVIVPIEQESATYDDQGNLLTPVILDPCYHVDIVWVKEEPELFATFRIFPTNPKHTKS